MSRPAVDTVQPESARFTASLLFVHGLWSDAAVWRRPMGYFAHRGWQCHALNLHTALDDASSAAACAESIASLCRSLQPPPILIGHDAGALLALSCSDPPPVAIVAIAPLVPQAQRRLSAAPAREWPQRWAAWRGRAVPPPRDVMAWFGRPQAPHQAGESAAFLAAVDRLVPRPPTVPSLFVIPDDDAVAAPAEQAEMARRLGAETLCLPGGHGLPIADGWETCVAMVHRWLVQRLGASLLAWLDDMERGDL
jgi:pimeloyl-ACP methyl ester carboxylesterase